MASKNREDLHDILVEILGSNAVYFQPPATIKMEYPCIVYSLVTEDSRFADNIPYYHKKRYKIMLIGRDPDTDIPDKIKMLQSCTRETRYVVDNLYHDVFYLYF